MSLTHIKSGVSLSYVTYNLKRNTIRKLHEQVLMQKLFHSNHRCQLLQHYLRFFTPTICSKIEVHSDTKAHHDPLIVVDF